MRSVSILITAAAGFIWLLVPKSAPAQGSQIPQGHQTQYWTTANADPQRDSWVRLDPQISLPNMKQKSTTFGLVRRVQFEKNPVPGRSSSQIIFESAAGGYKSMGYVVDSAGYAVGFDSDTSQVFWKVPLSSVANSGRCGTELSASLARSQKGWIPRIPTYPAIEGGYPYGIEAGFRVRDHQPPASGTLGEPHKGAVNIDETNMPALPTGAPRPDAAERASYSVAPGGIFALSADGLIHQLSLLKGFDILVAPAPFLPANARAAGLIGVDGRLYAASVGRCGGSSDGIWSIDINSPDKSVISRKVGADIAGTVGPAFGTDGTVFFATGEATPGDPDSASVISLNPKTLERKDYFSAQSGFASSPVVLRHGSRDLVAVLNRDGRLYLLDGAALGGTGHKSPLSVSAKFANLGIGSLSGALASWQSADGTSWVLVPVAGPISPEAHFPAEKRLPTNGAIAAFKVIDQNGVPTLQAGWLSPDMVSPLPPLIINGVIFAASAGDPSPAVLFALDGTSGESLWNSGSILKVPARTGGISTIYSTVFLMTVDDTLWAFGFPQDKQ